jgi:ABC-2 type transport system ATP-binding protein
VSIRLVHSSARAIVTDADAPVSPGEPAIRVRGLRKSFGAVEAVRGIDLTVQPGEIVALLGPNGAGKTTIVEILEGYRARDAGEVEVLGQDPARPTREWRARIGLVLQTCRMPPELTVRELVERYAGYYPQPRGVAETIALVGLTAKSDARAGSLSGGQQRRLDVALALVGDPDLVFLDEPTTGFDPGARHEAWEMLAELRRLGMTILLTTHYMDEAEALADRVAVVVRGQVVAEGPPQHLADRDRAPCQIRFRLPPGIAPDDLPHLLADEARFLGGVATVRTTTPVATLGALVDWARARSLELPDLVVARPSLEDIFLELTKGAA